MSAQRKSTKASSETGVTSRPANTAIAAPPTRSPPVEPLHQQKYQELIHKHLTRFLDALFAEFTGVHFHIAWRPAPPRQWDARTLLINSPRLPECRTCGPKQLARALNADEDGHCFTCRLGVRNYWLPIRVCGETLGIAYLQALDGPTARLSAGARSVCVAHARLRRAGARVSSRLRFSRAARFLRLIVQHAQTASLADLRQEDLTKVRQAVLVFENVQARLRKELNGILSAVRKTPPASQPKSRSERIVHALLDRIQRDYAQPLTLQKYARDLRVNAAYLSHLFSHAIGLPYKTCLTEVRIEKARELLGDPAQNISQVASAVGYASPNRFRIAFKQATGLSPRMWRETLRVNP